MRENGPAAFFRATSQSFRIAPSSKTASAAPISCARWHVAASPVSGALDCGKRACAADGEDNEAWPSKPHLLVRSLVQTAMMNALRYEGMSWGLYEIAAGLRIARDAPLAARVWLAGGDPLAPASAPAFDRQRAAAIFDTIDRL